MVVHTGKRDFLCQFCPQRFGRKDHLVRHIKKSHHNQTTSSSTATEASTPAKRPAKYIFKILSFITFFLNKNITIFFFIFSGERN